MAKVIGKTKCGDPIFEENVETCSVKIYENGHVIARCDEESVIFLKWAGLMWPDSYNWEYKALSRPKMLAIGLCRKHGRRPFEYFSTDKWDVTDKIEALVIEIMEQ
jgi:hypothetical protein